MKFLGQHFLRNQGVIKKIVAELDVQKGDTIMEIGPGHGELTMPLAEACEKVGAKLIAVERDEKLLPELNKRIEKEGRREIEIVNENILDFLKTFPGAPSLKIVGNIPYYITGHLLRAVSELTTKPTRAIFMIQKEVAERICAEPPRMNRLAASVQFWAEPKIIARVPRTDFSPPPEVDSAVIKLETKNPQPKNAERYYVAMQAIFAQPRKTILNNVADSESNKLDKKEKTAEALNSIGVDPKKRPQDLTIADIIKIANALF